MTTQTPIDETHIRVCPLCEATCGLEVTVRDGRVRRTRGDRLDPFSKGFICPKGSTLGHLREDPDWLRSPLIKRNGKHEAVSFEEAFDYIEVRMAELLKSISGDERGIYLGNPSVHNPSGSLYLRPMLMALGTFNIFTASTVDQAPRHISSGLMYGDTGLFALPDIDRTDFMLILGADPLESNGSLATAPDWPGRLKAVQARAGRIVVVDPRTSKTAKLADQHLSIVPGTDALLLASLVHRIASQGQIDPGPAGAHITGIEEAVSSLKEFTPERVASHTGIKASVIRDLADELNNADKAIVYGRVGIHTTEFGTLASWLSDLLVIITGNLDRPGGMMFGRSASAKSKTVPGGRGFSLGRWESPLTGEPERNGEFPCATLGQSILGNGDKRLRLFVTVAGNPVLSTPDSSRLDEALKTLDFMVSVDPYLNETTRHADVIIPPPSPLERSHYDFAFSGISLRRVPRWSPPVFDPTGPLEHTILARLTQILRGETQDPDRIDDELLDALLDKAVADTNGPAFQRSTDELRSQVHGAAGPDRILDVMLRVGSDGEGFGANTDGLSLKKLQDNPHGIDMGPLEQRLPNVLKTRSGLVEAAPTELLDDLSRLEARLAQAPVSTTRLVGRRQLRSNNSWMHNLAVLVKGKERCTLHINPEDAAELDISTGDMASVASKVGQIQIVAEVTEDISRGVVSIPHGWGHDMEGTQLQVAAKTPGVNSNILTDGSIRDPLSGNARLNGIEVEISAV